MAIRFDEIEFSGTDNHYYPVLRASGEVLKTITSHGYIAVGPANSSYAHITTDRPSFYFNNPVAFDGNITGYGTNETATFATFYDLNNTGYYADPNSTSKFYDLRIETGVANNNKIDFHSTSTAGYSALRFFYNNSEQNTIHIFGSTWASSNWPGNSAGAINLSGSNGVTIGTWSSPGAWIYNSGQAQFQNSVRSPIFYDSNNTAYYVNPAAGNTSQSFNTNGIINRDGFSTSGDGDNNILLRAQDYTHWIWQTATNWGIMWAGNDNPRNSYWSTSNPNEIVFIGSGATRASIDLDNGNTYFGGQVRATLYYDLNNTTYYFNGADTSVSAQVAGPIVSTGPTSGTTAANRAFQVNTTTKGALHSTAASGGTSGAAHTAPLITVTGNGSTVQGGIYVSQNASTGTSLGFFTTDSYATGPKQSLTIEDSGKVYVNRNFLQAVNSVRAPIFYDSDNTSYFYDGNNSASLAGTMNIWGGTSSTYGNQLIIGQQSISAAYTLQDTNVRPLIYLTGAYPALTLNHTVTSNTNHGPTIQYSHNGSNNRQWVHGSSGDGEHFFFGYSDSTQGNSDHNPHKGIAGWNGTSMMTFKNNGYVGIGGDWGGLGVGDPAYAIDTRGTLYNNTDVRAPIFYSSSDTSYYLYPNNQLSLKVYGEICNSNAYEGNLQPGALNFGRTDTDYRWNGSTWASDVRLGMLLHCADYYEIGVHDSGEAVHSFTYYNGNDFEMGRDIGWGTTHFTFTESVRSPIFYDSNDTSYYLDPNTTGNSLVAAGKIIGSNINTYIKYLGTGVSYDTDRSTKVTDGIATYSAYPGGSNTPHTYDFSAQFVGNSRGFELSAAWHSQTSLAIRSLRDCCQNWSSWYTFALHGLNNSTGVLYAGAYYDASDTNYLVDPNHISNLKNITTEKITVTTGSIGSNDAGTKGLIIHGNYTTGQYAHRFRKQDLGGNVVLFLDQSGGTANSFTWLTRFGAYSGNGFEFEVNGDMKANGDMHSNRLYDGANTTFYFDGADTGTAIRVAGDIIAFYSSDKRYKDNIKPIENSLDKINKIGGYTFEWNELSHKETGKKDVGVIAQEVEEVLPEVVETRSNGYKAVDYQKLTALLIESVKELKAEVEELKKQIK